MYSIFARGTANSSDFRVYFRDADDNLVSPFHDIPLIASDEGETLYNMVVEIPRWTQAKMEIATKEPFNPIKQDERKGKLRFVRNCFPYHGYIWNYGALPQTWENPSHVDPHTQAKGDNDPIDVCEIGSQTLERGAIVPVKLLGVMALIDDGETDWKLIVIKADDPLAEKLNDVQDISTHLPGLLEATHEWFKIYKIPDGKPANCFAFDGQAKGVDFARKIIEETHMQWKSLVRQDRETGLSIQTSTLKDSKFYTTPCSAEKLIMSKQPEFNPGQGLSQEQSDELLKVHYVKA